MSTGAPSGCNEEEEEYQERLRLWLAQQALGRARRSSAVRVRRWRWRKALESYVKDCAFSGSSLEWGIRMNAAELILSKLSPTVFGTLTFPAEWGEQARYSTARRFLKRWMPHGRYVIAFERHNSGSVHLHFVAEDRETRRLSMLDAWRVDTGGGGRIEPVQDQAAVAGYVAKYIVKAEGGELEFGEGVK